jgi:hypothetical protein
VPVTLLAHADEVIEWRPATSVLGMFDTCRLTLKLFAFWRLSEVPFQGRQDRF